MADQIAGKGSLSKNAKKSSDKHPGMLGSITFTDDVPAGTKLWLATWLNTNDNGTYVRINATWPQERGESAGRDDNRPPARRAQKRDLGDEIPF